jgi:cation diffusion facilitator CzcD-associated flavoprotein CzcO
MAQRIRAAACATFGTPSLIGADDGPVKRRDDQLQQEWEWTERYASQPEILRYLNHVADRFDLRRDIACNTRVLSAVFDEAGDRWQVRTDEGAKVSARFCIMATGCLSPTPKSGREQPHD